MGKGLRYNEKRGGVSGVHAGGNIGDPAPGKQYLANKIKPIRNELQCIRLY